MKSKLISSVLVSFIFAIASSQVPQGFNYQAVATDGNGSALSNKDIQVKFGILSDTVTPVVVWEELHSSVRTNQVGLFNLVIGTGERQSGVASFSDIKWSDAQMFIRIKLNYLGVWRTMGSARLWTVPYAMAAGSISGPISKLNVSGEESSPDSALFEVRNKDGQIVFAVYNEGVRVYVDDGVAKGATKGGFAIGGFNTNKSGPQDFFIVSPDSIRAYIGTNPGKGVKGGFAIGGFNNVKALPEEYMRVTRDSTRVYISEPGKSAKGGFAIGGFSKVKGNTSNYVNLTPDNYFIGHEAGTGIINGLYNSAFGYQAGKAVRGGNSNIFIGYQAGTGTVDGSVNVFLGYQAGFNNTSGWSNIFIGEKTGFINTTGYSNSFFGHEAGYMNESGWDNCFIGQQAGYSNKSGTYNCFMGYQSGYSSLSDYGNTFLGYRTGANHIAGVYNVYLGFKSGESDSTGFANVFIGAHTGLNNKSGSENTYIGYISGMSSTKTSRNTFIGCSAGLNNVTGEDNTYIGHEASTYATSGSGNVSIGREAGRVVGTGSNNVFIGHQSGYSSTGDGNVFVGYQAGYTETGSDRLYVGNSISRSPLIWGDFAGGKMAVNTNNSLGFNLYVNGSGASLVAWATASDARLKENIQTIPDALSKVLNLRGVNFTWKDKMVAGDKKQMGFIAQEAADIIPEVVVKGDDHLSIQYAPITALLVEAIKEQQKVIEGQKLRIEKLEQQEARLDELERLVNSMKSGNN